MAAPQLELTCITDELMKKNNTLEDLYKCPLFFGVLSQENAKEILIEAKQNDENSDAKSIIFLKTDFDDIKQHHFTIVLGRLLQHDPNGQPQFYFHENYLSWTYSIFENLVMRKNPFSLQELATVKTAASGVNLETLKLPKMIKNEVNKYQAFIKTLGDCVFIMDMASISLLPEIVPQTWLK